MGRNSVQTLRDGWRERLFWGSLATALIALLLFGLIALAEWGERADAAPIAGVATQPGSTGLMADVLTRALAPLPPFVLPLPQLPAVGAAPSAWTECGSEDSGARNRRRLALQAELCAFGP